MDSQDRLRCPFKGWMSYTEKDTSFFFGREPEIDLIIDKLKGSRLTVLYGPSGVGKSSILRAGVVSRLRKQAEFNIKEYDIPKFAAVFFNSWQDDPTKALINAVKIEMEQLCNLCNKEVPELDSSLEFYKQLEAWAALIGDEQAQGQIFIILDQFEEYFHHCQENGKGSFAVEFSRAVNRYDLPVNFLISLRKESFTNLDYFQSSIQDIGSNRLELQYLNENSATDAIIQPILAYNKLYKLEGKEQIKIDDGDLVKKILKQSRSKSVSGFNIQLNSSEEMKIEPLLLQLIMDRLWQKEIIEKKISILKKDILKMTAISNILNDYFLEKIELLSDEEKDIASRIFYFLVTPDGYKNPQKASALMEFVKEDHRKLPKLSKLQIERIPDLLKKLSNPDFRILRSLRKDQYEVYHDKLCNVILDWQKTFITERNLVRDIVKFVIIAVMVTTLLIGGTTGVSIWKLSKDLKITEQRLIGIDAIQQTESSSQLMALQEAMQMAQTVQEQDLELAFPIATLTLQQILSTIQEQNQFQALAVRGLIANQADLSPNGELAATSFIDGTVSLWNMKGEKLIDFKAHEGLLSRIIFLADNQRLATAGTDGTAAIWDIQGNQLTKFKLPKEAGWVVNFSPDGQLLVTTDAKGTIRVWTLEGDKVSEFHAHQGWILAVSFSLDGQKLATAGQDNIARLWDLQGKQLAELKGHQGAVYFVKFGPKGQKMLTGGQDGIIRVWNLQGEELQQFRQEKGAVYYLGISPNGERVATASVDGIVRLWDDQGNRITEFKGHENVVIDVSFIQNGQQLATITRNGTVRVWKLQEQQAFQAYTEGTLNSQLRFKPDGQSLVIAADRGIVQWNLQGNQLATKGGTILSSFFTKDGQLKFVAFSQELSKEINIWDFQQDKPSATFKVSEGMVWKADVSPDEKWLFTSTFDAAKIKGQLWNIENPQDSPRELVHPNGASAVTVGFSADGQKLATASLDGEVAIWNVATLSEQPLVNFTASEGSFITALEFSSNGQQLVTASWDNTASLWDMQGKQLMKFEGHRASIQNIHFSPDGNWLLTSSLDGTARVWDLEGNQWAEYPGHGNSGVLDAVFSPNGKQVATISLDGYVQIWSVEEFNQLVAKGCNWLTDHLQYNSELRERLTICKIQH